MGAPQSYLQRGFCREIPRHQTRKRVGRPPLRQRSPHKPCSGPIRRSQERCHGRNNLLHYFTQSMLLMLLYVSHKAPSTRGEECSQARTCFTTENPFGRNAVAAFGVMEGVGGRTATASKTCRQYYCVPCRAKEVHE